MDAAQDNPHIESTGSLKIWGMGTKQKSAEDTKPVAEEECNIWGMAKKSSQITSGEYNLNKKIKFKGVGSMPTLNSVTDSRKLSVTNSNPSIKVTNDPRMRASPVLIESSVD